jgi:hypothetical protein
MDIQFIADFMMESIEMLERLANPQKPPLSVEELQKIRVAFMDPSSNKVELRRKLEGMAEAFQGRGDLSQWHFEMLDAIDECFVEHYMKKGEISTSLFVPDSPANINNFLAYCNAADEKLRGKVSQRPKYAREYFAYLSIWQVQGYSFPVPLGTQSVMRALSLLADEFQPGCAEVRCLYSSCVRPADGMVSYPRMGWSPFRG